MAQKLKHLLFGHYGGNIPFNPSQIQRRSRKGFSAVMLPQDPTTTHAYAYQQGQQPYHFTANCDVRIAKNKADKPYAVIRLRLHDFNRIVQRLPPIEDVIGEIFEVRIACRAEVSFQKPHPFTHELEANTLAVNKMVIVFRKNVEGRLVNDMTWELVTPVIIEIDPKEPV